MSLKGRRFESIDAMKENSLADLRSIRNETFQKCFEGWQKRWERCIQSGGDYFECDKTESLLRLTEFFLFKTFGNLPDEPRMLLSQARFQVSINKAVYSGAFLECWQCAYYQETASNSTSIKRAPVSSRVRRTAPYVGHSVFTLVSKIFPFKLQSASVLSTTSVSAAVVWNSVLKRVPQFFMLPRLLCCNV
jgi:hypothetical protein